MQRIAIFGVLSGLVLALLVGCPGDNGESSVPGYHNTSDPNNGGATYVGSSACSACHPGYGDRMRLHVHAHALNRVEGVAPAYPAEATTAGVPNPPPGKTWTDISYVLDGYAQGALFIDRNGYVMTTGVDGVATQYNLAAGATGISAGFVPYLPGQATPLPFSYEMFSRRTTGARPQTAADPRSQEGRPGIQGTWSEAGVGCEACHGPGSKHVPGPQARNIFVDSTAQTCGRCHTDAGEPNAIVVLGGYLGAFGQYAELRASGGHAPFNCTFCHDPHASTRFDRSRGIRNDCTACHPTQNLAFHEGVQYQRGTYTETVTCVSCHMPLTGVMFAAAGAEVVGGDGRAGDVRGHIFRIDAQHGSVTQMVTSAGDRVATDAQGRAAVTLDFVCLRCHNGKGNAFLLTPSGATEIAPHMHVNAGATP